MQFDIQPYRGAVPILFGMHRDEVHRILGFPEHSFHIRDGSGVSESYAHAGYNVGFDSSDFVKHVGFGPGGSVLTIDGQPIWTLEVQPDPNPVFLSLDPNPLEFVGFWFFLRIGVTTTGYHDGDEGQLAIAIFPKNSIADLLLDALPADISKYRKR